MKRLQDREKDFLRRRESTLFGEAIRWYDVVDSTNDIAKKLASEGAIEGTLVVANEQRSGRGRHGRIWISPANEGLWFSVILRPRHSLEAVKTVAKLNRVGADAVATALNKTWNIPAYVKEPNDVLVEGRKICGILCEASMVAGAAHPDWLIVGCGLNLTTHLPEELLSTTTKLAKWLDPCPPAEEVLARICEFLEILAQSANEK